MTPLTARVIACFTAKVSVGALLLSLDRRSSAWRVLLQTFLAGTALLQYLPVANGRARGPYEIEG